MKQLIGGIAGALITGVAILGWNGPTTRGETAWDDAQARGSVQLASDERGTPAAVMEGEAARAALSVTCEPGQRAILRRVPAAGGMTMEAGCEGSEDIASLPGVRGFAPAPPRAVPVAYSAPRVASARSARQNGYVAPRRVEPQRSWKKRALVIGGSAGAGAGVGALAGGKKGALIGAAIGGGAGTLYEVIKH